MKEITIAAIQEIFEKSLQQTLRYHPAPIELMEAMVYSLLNGGKRLRPVMLLWILSLHSIDKVKKGLNTALALECIHTYSLIHDDLPAMDNDDYRRGQLSNHKKFGEARAILAGDALLTDAFYWISQDESLSDHEKVALIMALSQSAGSLGMVAGQLMDMEGEGKDLSFDQLSRIHQLKTGKLFSFSVKAACIIGQISSQETSLLESFAHYFGRAFQIHNDLMDQIAGQDETGKKEKADSQAQKATYPRILSLQGAYEELNKDLSQARQSIDQLSVLRPDINYASLNYFIDQLVLE